MKINKKGNNKKISEKSPWIEKITYIILFFIFAPSIMIFGIQIVYPELYIDLLFKISISLFWITVIYLTFLWLFCVSVLEELPDAEISLKYWISQGNAGIIVISNSFVAIFFCVYGLIISWSDNFFLHVNTLAIFFLITFPIMMLIDVIIVIIDHLQNKSKGKQSVVEAEKNEGR